MERRPNGWRCPHYQWQHERFWQESRRVRTLRLDPSHYAMLGKQADRNIFTQLVTAEDPSWLKDHNFHSQVILSASSMMEMGFEAAHARQAQHGLGFRPLVLDHVHIDAACFLNTQMQLQTVVGEDGYLTIYSESIDGTEKRQVNFRAHICDDPGAMPANLDFGAIEARLPIEWKGSLIKEWAARGLILDPRLTPSKADAVDLARRWLG